MNCKLFVGNLAFSTTEDELRDTFSEIGAVVSAKIITDRETGKPRGFGFVEMTSEEDGQAAIERFHQSSLGGRTINVNVAKPQTARSGGGGGGNYNRGRGDRGSRDRAPRESRW